MAKPDLIRLHGLHAVRAALEQRPDAVRRLFLSQAQTKPLGEALRRLAQQRRPYRMVEDDELQALAKSAHHEGLVADLDPRPPASDGALFGDGAPVLGLDHVDNPNNLGAICRSCAHFGAGLVAAGGPKQLQGAAARVAQGGAEVVAYRRVDEWGPTLKAARDAGYACWALDGAARDDAFSAPIPDRVFWIIGSERDGIGRTLRRQADAVLRLGGTGAIESLNASVAAGVALALGRRARP